MNGKMVMVIGAIAATLAFSPGIAGGASPGGCSAEAGAIHLQADGTGVRASRTTVVCSGRWHVNQAILWSDATGQWVNGKWSYGGDRDVYGRGSMTIAAFDRAYHHCAWWKQRVTLNGQVFDSSITKFCS